MRIGAFRFAMAMFAGTALPPGGLTAQAADSAPVTRVGTGVTRLLDEPRARIGYAYASSPTSTVWLGAFWQGYDRPSGVWFDPYGPATEGRRPVFMHCPYRPGPGRAFAEFALAMPAVSPITLELGFGLRPDVKDTDGVTFRALIDSQVLFERHTTDTFERRAAVDLSGFAGRTVTLRLEVGPGKDGNTRNDWALWHRADIRAGSDEDIARARKAQQRAREASLQAELAHAAIAAERDVSSVCGRDARGVLPSTFERPVATLRREGDRVLIEIADSVDRVVYALPARLGEKGQLPIDLTVNGKRVEPAPFTLAPRPVYKGKVTDEPLVPRSADVRLTDVAANWRIVFGEPDALSLAAGRENREGESPRRTLTLSAKPSGKSLVISLAAPAEQFDGVAVRRRGGTTIPFVYGVAPIMYFGACDAYVSVAADLWHSDARVITAGGSRYDPLTDGSRRALRDVYCVTASSRYEEVVPNVPHAPSPFLDELASRVVLDVWRGAFADDARWLRELAVYGVNRLIIIKHVWQRDGYDRTYPDVMPANAAQGGDRELRALSQTARALGHRFCVHENFYDYYPNAEDFRAEDCALQSNGARIPGWDRGPVKAVILKPSRLMDYAKRFSPEVKRRYDCNAAYHDIMPTWRVDQDARVPDSGMIRVTHAITKRLCDFDRQLFGGPVLFEAADPRMAGVYDGGTASGRDIETYRCASALELLKVHPKMGDHGMSYYERWLSWGYGPGWATYVMTDRELDKYRAMTIAFGRVGFIGHQLMPHPHGVVREYHLMQAFGRACTGQLPTRIQYRHGNQWIDAATAARLGMLDRLHVVYEGDQHVYVNSGTDTWTVAGHTLPPYGALTTGPRATAWTALVDGQIADFAQVDGVLYADARSHVWQPKESVPPIRPGLADFRDLGNGRFSATVRWTPERRPERDLIAFWHLRANGEIFLQNDHRPETRTRTWEPGQTVLDGPIVFQLKPGAGPAACDLVVGLYDKQGRVPLLGDCDEVAVTGLAVEREPGRIVRVTTTPPGQDIARGNDSARYRKESNTSGRVLRFPGIATSGAVVRLPLDDGGFRLVPVPLDTPITIGLPGSGYAIKPAPGVRVEDGWTWFETQSGDMYTCRLPQ